MTSVQLAPLSGRPSPKTSSFAASLAAYNDEDYSSESESDDAGANQPRVYSSIRGGGPTPSSPIRGGAPSTSKRSKYAVLEMLRLPSSASDLLNRAHPYRNTIMIAIALLLIIVVAAAVMISGSNSSDAPLSPSPSPPPSSDIDSLRSSSYLPPSADTVAAVATDHPLCSAAAIGVMSPPVSGSAADAAISAALCLGVVNMASSGLGGGCFVLAGGLSWPRGAGGEGEGAESPAVFIDGREEAPAATTWNMFEGLDKSASTDGGLAVAVLGELKALEKLHEMYGRAEWQDVVRPARDLARDGFKVSAVFAAVIKKQEVKIRKNAALTAVLSSPSGDGTLLKEGEVLKQPQLASTLDAIMDQGSRALYSGPLAASLVADVQEQGGILTVDDLAAYETVIRQPLVATVSGRTIVGAPPPSSGGAAVVAVARFLKGFADADTVDKNTANHRLSEAMKHAFAMRMSLADPNPQFDTNATVKEVVDDMIKGDYIDYLRFFEYADDRIMPTESYGGPRWSMDATNDDPQLRERIRRELQGFQYLEDHGTSHLSVVDSEGNTVALTSTVNTEFGSGVMSPSTGILLNNQMDDFASPGRPNAFGLSPAPINYPAPKKRPLSSMSPTLVYEEERLRLACGASGGPKIITGTVQTLLNHLFDGMDLFDAVTNPRIHDQLLLAGLPKLAYSKEVLIGGQTIDLNTEQQQDLIDRGHGIQPSDYMGTCQAVSIDKDGIIAAMSDVRKGGTPMGLKKVG